MHKSSLLVILGFRSSLSFWASESHDVFWKSVFEPVRRMHKISVYGWWQTCKRTIPGANSACSLALVTLLPVIPLQLSRSWSYFTAPSLGPFIPFSSDFPAPLPCKHPFLSIVHPEHCTQIIRCVWKRIKAKRLKEANTISEAKPLRTRCFFDVFLIHFSPFFEFALVFLN